MDREGEEVDMMGQAIDSLFDFLAADLGIGILLRASLVLGCAGLTTRLAHRSSAAFRCAMWGTAFTLLVLLPILSIALPAWQIAPSTPTSAKASEARLATAIPTPPSAIASDPVSTPWLALVPDVERYEAVVPHAWREDGEMGLLVGIWAAGSLLLLLRLLVHALRAAAIVRRARRGSATGLEGPIRDLGASLRIRRRVQVLLSSDVTMPFTWGLRRPVVVFPESAPRWPAGQLRSVMLHELAHIARWDYPLHVLVEIARAFYWPNPIAWLAARRMAMERERACDDMALRHGISSSTYAIHLLNIARMQLSPAPAGVTTMAGEVRLFERVRSVMNRDLDRSPVQWRGALLIGGLTLALAGPAATIDLLAIDQAWDPPTPKESIEQLTGAEDAAERRMAAWWLGEHDDTSEGLAALTRALHDPIPDVRLVAGWALGEIKDPAAIEPLITTMMADPEPLVREMAVLALGEITDPQPIGALLRALDQDESLWAAVVWALGEIKGQAAAAARSRLFARRQLEPWDHEEVWTGRLSDQEIYTTDFDVACRDLRHGDDRHRGQAAWTLGMMGYLDLWSSWEQVTGCVHALLEALRDPAAEVRALAVWALDEIGPSWSIRDWRRAAFTPEFHQGRLNAIGRYLIDRRRFDPAIEVLDFNRRIHPNSVRCHEQLGEAYWQSGRRDLAAQHFRRSLELDPENRYALDYILRYREERGPDS